MRITSKGQVTIPQDIRERSGLQPGTDVAFEYDGKVVRLRKAPPRRAPRAKLPNRRARLSIKDEIMEISRRASRLPRYTNETPDEIIGYDEHGLPR